MIYMMSELSLEFYDDVDSDDTFPTKEPVYANSEPYHGNSANLAEVFFDITTKLKEFKDALEYLGTDEIRKEMKKSTLTINTIKK